MKIQMNRFIRNFLLAVKHIDSFFSESFFIQMKKTTLNIFDVIKNFRHNVRMLNDVKSAFSHSAFAIYDSKKSSKESSTSNENKKTFFRKKNIESFECICDKNH